MLQRLSSSFTQQIMLGLWCSVKTYHWGARGSESLVARLATRACRDFVVDERQTYAEVSLVRELSLLPMP